MKFPREQGTDTELRARACTGDRVDNADGIGMELMLRPAGIALFCEDIREEKSDLVTLVGCYGDYLVLPEMPAAMAKLGIYIRISLPVEFEATDIDVVYCGPLDEDQTILQFPRDLIKEQLSEAKKEGAPTVSLAGHVLAVPFAVEAYGRMQVNLQWKKQRTFLGAVTFVPPQATAATAEAQELLKRYR